MIDKFWIPSSAEIHGTQPTMYCTVIVDVDGGKCGKPFYPGEQARFERHVGECARRHDAEVQHHSPKNSLAGFLEATGQPDVEQWLEETDAAGESNRQKAIDGRKKL